MNRHHLAIALPLLAVLAAASTAQARAACPPADPTAVADTVREMYAALSVDDMARMQRVLAPGFYAYDAGKRFDGPALGQLVEAAHKAGKRLVWTVQEPDVRIACDRAWIAYVNRGSIGDATGSEPVTWLESAMLRHQDGRWRIEFFHSSHAAKAP
jgi:hypothetical protein